MTLPFSFALLQQFPIDNEAVEALAGLAALGCFGTVALALVFVLVLVVFPIWCFWRICSQAGYHGAMSLLLLIPLIGGIVLILILAFSRWPIQNRIDDSQL